MKKNFVEISYPALDAFPIIGTDKNETESISEEKSSTDRWLSCDPDFLYTSGNLK